MAKRIGGTKGTHLTSVEKIKCDLPKSFTFLCFYRLLVTLLTRKGLNLCLIYGNMIAQRLKILNQRNTKNFTIKFSKTARIYSSRYGTLALPLTDREGGVR